MSRWFVLMWMLGEKVGALTLPSKVHRAPR